MLLLPVAFLACSEGEKYAEVNINLDQKLLKPKIRDQKLLESGIDQLYVYSLGDSKTIVVYTMLAPGSVLLMPASASKLHTRLMDGFVPLDKSFNLEAAQKKLDYQYAIKKTHPTF